MIPNSLSSTGPYAGLWSHLKSIDHALDRVQNGEFSDLDKERLTALISILESGVTAKRDTSHESPSLLVLADEDQPDYSSALNLREALAAVPEFANWLKKSKIGHDAKLQRLVAALQDVVNAKELFAPDLPQEEFGILRIVLQSLLCEAEIAL